MNRGQNRIDMGKRVACTEHGLYRVARKGQAVDGEALIVQRAQDRLRRYERQQRGNTQVRDRRGGKLACSRSPMRFAPQRASTRCRRQSCARHSFPIGVPVRSAVSRSNHNRMNAVIHSGIHCKENGKAVGGELQRGGAPNATRKVPAAKKKGTRVAGNEQTFERKVLARAARGEHICKKAKHRGREPAENREGQRI